jgi:hypothetical protein
MNDKIDEIINYYKKSTDQICYFSRIQRILKVGYTEALSIRDKLIEIGFIENETYKIKRD